MKHLAITLLLLLAVGSTARAGDDPDFAAGIERYKAKDYDGASAAFEKAYAAAPDGKILFAWAQSERFAGRCQHSIELFQQLLSDELTEANRTAVERNISECQAVIAAAPPVEPVVEPPPVERPPDDVIRLPMPAPTPEGRPWYKDPVGLGFLGGGVVGLGVGIAIYGAAVGRDSAADDATTYAEFADKKAQAKRLGTIGVVTGVAGVALIGAGVAWYVLHHRAPAEGVTVSFTDGGGVVGWAGSY